MARKPKSEIADAAPLKRYAKVALGPKLNPAHMAHETMAGIRKADHAGHKIEIRTEYQITVDGKSLTIPHLSVGNDGQLVCHALPNYVFASAVDLVKAIIDAYPDEFAKRPRKPPPEPPDHDDHGGGHGGHH